MRNVTLELALSAVIPLPRYGAARISAARQTDISIDRQSGVPGYGALQAETAAPQQPGPNPKATLVFFGQTEQTGARPSGTKSPQHP